MNSASLQPQTRSTQPSDGSDDFPEQLPSVRLSTLSGKTVSNRTLAGKHAVLMFGSYTSPSFRARLPALEAIVKPWSRRVNFVIIYTAEAHPAGQWEVGRNMDEGISVEAHADFDARAAAARLARDRLNITIDVVPEPMDDVLSTPYQTRPNGALVIDDTGRVLLRQRHADPHGIERALRDAIAS